MILIFLLSRRFLPSAPSVPSVFQVLLLRRMSSSPANIRIFLPKEQPDGLM